MIEGRRGEGIIKIPFPNCHIAFVMAARSCTCSCRLILGIIVRLSLAHSPLFHKQQVRVTEGLCIIYTSVLCNFHHPPTDTIQIQQHAYLFIMHDFPSLRYTLQVMLSYFFFSYLLIYTSFALQMYVIHSEYFMQKVILMGFESC